ncbi:LysR family transcriptional regulator [Thalassotalea sp. PLHSN55]|uniref:LysR family transcriptional regulator n=1 Tax=Thalassotalea sp. PLHSN55 TaxID=3435888 RepID=UPI003F84E659
MNFDLNIIRTFLQVHKCKSYTQAARQLNVSQQAVSASMKRLSNKLNFPLFIKSGRTIEPTAHADQLATRFMYIMDEIDNAMLAQNRFTVYLAEPFLYLINRNKNIIYQEPPANQYDLIQDIRQQKVDLGISTLTIKDTGLIFEELFREKGMVICRENHPRIKGALNEEVFYQESHIVHRIKWDDLSGFEYGSLVAVKERKVDVVANSLSGLVMHVASSNSLAIVSESFCRYWQKKLNLQVLDSPIPLRDLTYTMVYHRRFLNEKQHQLMRENLKAQIKQLPFAD